MALTRPRTLVLRALGLGDFLTAVPALRALRAAHPDHALNLASPAALRPLADLAGVCESHFDTAGLAALDWSEPPPTLAVNLHGRGPQSHRVLKCLSPRSLVAFGCPDADHVGPQWREDEHEAQRWCRLLEDVLRIPADPTDLHLPRPAPRRGTVAASVVIHAGAAFGSRRWPAERFAAVARWAAAAGHPVVLTGGPGERALAEAVAHEAHLPAGAVRAGATDLVALADQVAAASLVVCGDTGVAHLATAFATPSVLLFGPTAPSRWGPITGGPHAVIWRGDGTGDPWGTDVDPALAAIEPAEVIVAAEELLAAAGPPQARDV